MHHWTDLAESFLKMYGFAMLRTAGQNLYQVYHCVHYFVLFIIYVSTGTHSHPARVTTYRWAAVTAKCGKLGAPPALRLRFTRPATSNTKMAAGAHTRMEPAQSLLMVERTIQWRLPEKRRVRYGQTEPLVAFFRLAVVAP